MKKILVLIMIFLSFSLFAYESKTDHVYVKGFFAQQEASLVFKVWKNDTNTNRIYHAGRVDVTGLDAGEVTVFNWELTANTQLNITLKFTITPLQAFSNGTYFIPKHTVKMYDGSGALTQSHDFSTAKTGSSSYPGYRQSTSGDGVFIIKSAEFTYNETINDQTPMSGYCTIRVLKYDDVTAGDFDYVSYVTVEFSTQ